MLSMNGKHGVVNNGVPVMQNRLEQRLWQTISQNLN